MKLIPGKYYSFDDDTIHFPPGNNALPLWDYIEMNLKAQNRDEKELLDLFDITPTALKLWENGKRGISRDKLVILCNMFGVTIDQMLDRDFCDYYQLEDFYGLSKFNDKANPNKFTNADLFYLFDKLNETVFCIEYFALGYVPFMSDDELPENQSTYRIDNDEVEYYCSSLNMNVTYDLSDGKIINVESIKYSELCEIAKILSNSWGDKSCEHITAKPDIKYNIMLLKSENAKALDMILKNYGLNINELLDLWISLKKNDKTFDSECKMAKVLLFNGGKICYKNGIDYKASIELFEMIIKNDVRIILGNKGEK